MSSDKEFGNNHVISELARCLELTSLAHGEFTDVAVGGAKEANTDFEDAEMQEMRKKIQKMREERRECENLKKMFVTNTTPTASSATSEVDGRSIWVGNVDYGATLEGLNKHFEQCGLIIRTKILRDKFSGKSKGFAYIEFSDVVSIDLALKLNESLFCGRQIKVTAKRTNIYGLSTTDRKPRGRGIRPRGGPMAGRGRYLVTAQHIPTPVPRFESYMEQQPQCPAYRSRGNNRKIWPNCSYDEVKTYYTGWHYVKHQVFDDCKDRMEHV
ncbi:hypothetical protein HELRODRAFT_182961 [Helobdella robusta]|uniref:RRM domain-containing protein n=1 Tax=Helobdella robusta TaxID=6412 RepID=T1FJ00_HELRO|nr:hypothetical protein HELRODRAFT_182961 [Helobdella robusta]ESN89951.1 hypothetical protein HELRODRAFT_182961 [Helobdella robusta]